LHSPEVQEHPQGRGLGLGFRVPYNLPYNLMSKDKVAKVCAFSK